DVLGAGHVGVEGADPVDDLAPVGGVGGDRVGRVGVEGEALPVAEEAGGLALGRGARGCVLEGAGDGADLGGFEWAGEGGAPGGAGCARGRMPPLLSAMPRLRAGETPRSGSWR